MGRNQGILRSTELLTWWSGDGGGGVGEKWQWCSLTLINEEHSVYTLAVYFQGTVYALGFGECVDAMEMLDVYARGLWISLASFGLYPGKRLRVCSMARIGNQLVFESKVTN
ncbi:unnamed protein product [Hymenolepis diminuta]|uniref:Mcl1_mid domain-containing protein n=1 Tax=Hymenolepis diminuta TaxID=6216 RepID=A0A0R3SVR5_HYMDI|nr:unnamed protein product [Hymenolepis diminuta]